MAYGQCILAQDDEMHRRTNDNCKDKRQSQKTIKTTMKKLVYILVTFVVALGIASCSKEKEEQQKWEYKTLTVWGDSYSDFWGRNIDVPQIEMDTLGAHGWELVDVYTRIETVHPNFGNDKYVTGLQANTRTAAVCYVFKRPLKEGQLDRLNKNEADSDTVVAVEEVAVEVADSVAY